MTVCHGQAHAVCVHLCSDYTALGFHVESDPKRRHPFLCAGVTSVPSQECALPLCKHTSRPSVSRPAPFHLHFYTRVPCGKQRQAAALSAAHNPLRGRLCQGELGFSAVLHAGGTSCSAAPLSCAAQPLSDPSAVLPDMPLPDPSLPGCLIPA